MQREFHVYIMASRSGTLYIGVTNNLMKRVQAHKEGLVDGFTKKYQCTKLVYFEPYTDIREALPREKQLKRWNRKKKEALIKIINPYWKDLSRTFWRFKENQRALPACRKR